MIIFTSQCVQCIQDNFSFHFLTKLLFFISFNENFDLNQNLSEKTFCFHRHVCVVVVAFNNKVKLMT